MFKTLTAAITVLWCATGIFAQTVDGPEKGYEFITTMKPAGYWPADEGSGDILHDRSGNNNHGRLYNTGWENGMPDFNGAFQWALIPGHSAYQGREFSIGGWVYTRTEVIGGQWPGQAGMTFIGNGYHHSGFTLDTIYNENVLFQKSKWSVGGGSKEGVSICVRKGELVDIISGGVEDAAGSKSRGVSIEVGKWQHILYTYKAGGDFEGGSQWKQMLDKKENFGKGTATVYVNGQAVCTQKNVKFTPGENDILIGSDAVWWLQSNVSGSLNGSVRDIVIFDRAIGAAEVKYIFDNTRIEAEPEIESARQDEDSLLGFSDKSESVLMDIILNGQLDKQHRAAAVLAICEKPQITKEQVVLLADMLEAIDNSGGTHLPRIEEHLRNALIKALLDNRHTDSRAEDVLAISYAKPILESADISAACFKDVKEAFDAKQYMEALDIYRKLDLNEYGDFFFSQGDINRDKRDWQPNTRAYTAAADYNGYSYRCGEGEAWKGVEKVPFEEYKKLMVEISGKYPEVLNWRSVSYEHLYRVPVIKTAPDGSEESVYLEGEKFILDGKDAKLRGWSIAVDNAGYIHITGGMHNAPVADNFIPGSWEQMGVSREYTDDSHPSLMYWVSSEPQSIESFEFMGQRSNPRNVPVPFGLNYMNFIQDRNGELYLYGRIHVQGIQSFGLYKYDTDRRRWDAVGGSAPDVKEEYPLWADYHIRMATDWLSLPTMRWDNEMARNKTLVWSLQPHFYNYMRGWGVRFDRENRMHVLMPMFGLDCENMNVLSSVYAFSDDGGKSFCRYDGSEVKLPLTNNPSPQRNAEIEYGYAKRCFKLWESLIKYAGHESIR
ncbi:MAG: hypothetical protein ACIAQZ_11970 [Sedimentisphaeraceae bacterium JB056]